MCDTGITALSQAIINGTVAFLSAWKENKLERSDLNNTTGKYIVIPREWLSEVSKGQDKQVL